MVDKDHAHVVNTDCLYFYLGLCNHPKNRNTVQPLCMVDTLGECEDSEFHIPKLTYTKLNDLSRTNILHPSIPGVDV